MSCSSVFLTTASHDTRTRRVCAPGRLHARYKGGSMQLDSRQLQRFDRRALTQPSVPIDIPPPPTDFDILLIAAGNSAEALALRCQALGYSDRVWFSAIGLNNDQ